MAGDLITGDHQYEYNGLLIGSGTNYKSMGWEGLFDSAPNVRSNDLTPNDRHGVIPGLDFMDGRTLTNQIALLTPDNSAPSVIFDMVETFQTAFRTRQDEIALVYKLPGRAKRFLNCRVRKSVLPKDADLTLGMGLASIQLFASNPIHRELAFTSMSQQVIGAGNTSKTFSMPTIIGNWWTPPVLTYTGAGDNIKLSMNAQDGVDGVRMIGTVEINVNLGAGDVLSVDFGAKTVKVNGTKVYTSINQSTAWWQLSPGANTIVIQRSSGAHSSSASFIDMSWRAGWLY